MIKILLVILFSSGLLIACNKVENNLPELNLDSASVTVSGLSSGGYMAHQYHIAYSDHVSGAALLASGPYGCAEGNLETALENCINNKTAPDINKLIDSVKRYANQQQIAALNNLQNDKVWIYHGTNDFLISKEITASLNDFYLALGVVPKVEFSIPSGHGFPTIDFGNTCETTQQPHINQCNYDAAGELFSYLYPDISPKTAIKGKLIAFNQEFFLDEGHSNTLAETGYLFVPKSCLQGEQCKLHIAFHGCQQNAEKIATSFVEKAGYNPWAEANNIVILYPQTTSSFIPLNPKACWDWWGYTGKNYQFRTAEQLQHVNNMVSGLSGRNINN